MQKTPIVASGVTIVLLFATLFITWRTEKGIHHVTSTMSDSVEAPIPSSLSSPSSAPRTAANPRESTLEDIPFTPQAPLAQWDNPIFQDACEEASLLMAAHALSGEPLGSPKEVTQKILDLVEYERTTIGEFRDTSAVDTAKLLQEYFDVTNITVETNITQADLKNLVTSNDLVIIPADGRRLNNPHFTSPGPERHMLLIHGYDPITDEFITNDPGTKHGHNYRYNSDILYQAIRDYPTGYHEPILSEQKNAIVINR